MADVYKSLIKAASNLLSPKIFGYQAMLVRDGSEEFLINIVVDSYDPRSVDGVLIEHTDRRILVSVEGLPVVPNAETDQLIENGNTLRIVTVKRIAPGGQNILFECQCREGTPT